MPKQTRTKKPINATINTMLHATAAEYSRNEKTKKQAASVCGSEKACITSFLSSMVEGSMILKKCEGLLPAIQLGGRWPFLRLATTIVRRLLDFFGAIVQKVLSRWLIDTTVQIPRSYSAPLRNQLRFSVDWSIWHGTKEKNHSLI